jgi:hypothetical protein
MVGLNDLACPEKLELASFKFGRPIEVIKVPYKEKFHKSKKLTTMKHASKGLNVEQLRVK